MIESLSASVYLNIIRDNCTKITYSQLGEDCIILDILNYDVKSVFGGFYVDAGAFHPRHVSNTRLLKLLGWRGINIDASEEAIATFNAERPDDINVCSGIGLEEGDLTYYMFADGASSTLSEDTAKQWERAGQTLAGIRKVPVRTLNQILDDNVPPGTAIDYMNIDLEGFDRSVILSLDLSRYRPAVLSIEIHGADFLNLGQDPTVAYLYGHKYELKAIARITFIFVDTTRVVK